MVTAIEPLLREQLLDRRQKLEVAAVGYRNDDELSRLLRESTRPRRRDGLTYLRRLS